MLGVPQINKNINKIIYTSSSSIYGSINNQKYSSDKNNFLKIGELKRMVKDNFKDFELGN